MRGPVRFEGRSPEDPISERAFVRNLALPFGRSIEKTPAGTVGADLEGRMRLMLAIFVPWLGLLTIGKYFQAFFCFILQCTVIGWLPAIIWSTSSVSRYYGDKRMDRFAEAIKGSRPPDPPPPPVAAQVARGAYSDAPRAFDVRPEVRFEQSSRSQAGSNPSIWATPETGVGAERMPDVSPAAGPEVETTVEKASKTGGFQSEQIEAAVAKVFAEQPKIGIGEWASDHIVSAKSYAQGGIKPEFLRAAFTALLYICLAAAIFAFVPEVRSWVVDRATELYAVVGAVARSSLGFFNLHWAVIVQSIFLLVLALLFYFFGGRAGIVGAMACLVLIGFVAYREHADAPSLASQRVDRANDANKTDATFLNKQGPKASSVESIIDEQLYGVSTEDMDGSESFLLKHAADQYTSLTNNRLYNIRATQHSWRLIPYGGQVEVFGETGFRITSCTAKPIPLGYGMFYFRTCGDDTIVTVVTR